MEIIHFAPNAAKGLGRKYKDDQGFVVRPAKVFECGDYPDKGFSLTEEEADAAIREFQPVHNNVEHRPSVFDRLLGTTEGLFRKGKEVFASLRIPESVDALLGDAPIPLSAEWSKEPKRYMGTALTVNPRVLTAAAHAFSTSPDFQTFAATHPEEAREIANEAAKAPVPAAPMLTQEQKIEEAKKAYAALPQFMRDEQTEAEFVKFSVKQDAKPAFTIDPAQEARIKALEENQAAQFKAQTEADDRQAAVNFYEEQLSAGKSSPATREKDMAEFSRRRRLDRLEAKDKGVTFSANAQESEESKLRAEFAEKAKLFHFGAPMLDSTSPAYVPQDHATGIFSKEDFESINPKKESK